MTADHELTVTTGPQTGTIGRCSCRLFSMVGPEDTIRNFHAIHLTHPETSLKGKAAR
jgi:hypothetical protein